VGIPLSVPTAPPANLRDVVAIAAGRDHSMALTVDGTVVAWGGSLYGQSDVPADLAPAFAIAASGNRSLAFVADNDSLSNNDSAGYIANLSVRSVAGSGDQTLIMGFVIGGEGSDQAVLVRGIGPTLANYGVIGSLNDPQLWLFYSDQTLLMDNETWGGTNTLRDVFASLGAFALPDSSRDAALLTTLPTGAYSAHVTSRNLQSGQALVELYDGTKSDVARFTNVSARTTVGTGLDVLIAGFVLVGNSPKTLLIRGIGPTLATYGQSVGGSPDRPVSRGYHPH